MLLSSLAALLYLGIDPIMVGLETTRSLSSFYAFLAVPFFILAGEIMNRGGLSERLINFVKAVLGHRRSGLPFVTIVSSQMFGAVSGASAATCAAIGGVMIPELEENGYSRPFATALAACAGTTGALIPPSIALIIYGTVAGVSIEQLFMAGVIPGLLVVYALFAGLVVYRQITLKDLPGIFLSAAKTTAALSFVLACAALFAWTMGIGRIPEVVTSALLNGTDSFLALLPADMDPETVALLRRLTILFVLNVALLLVGMVVDVAPALLIVVPVLLPVSEAIGMGSGLAAVQFGTLVVSNLVIGLVTPPVGTTLFVASGVGRVDVSQLVPHVLRFLTIMLVAQLLITYVPFVTRTLPSLMQ
jgi:TRAP-type C4-dicarboxylate transport system permease large subunit